MAINVVGMTSITSSRATTKADIPVHSQKLHWVESDESLGEIDKLKNLSIWVRDTINNSFLSPPKHLCYQRLETIERLFEYDQTNERYRISSIQEVVKQFFYIVVLCKHYGILSDKMIYQLKTPKDFFRIEKSDNKYEFVIGAAQDFLLCQRGNNKSFVLATKDAWYLKTLNQFDACDYTMVKEPRNASSCRLVNSSKDGWYKLFIDEYVLEESSAKLISGEITNILVKPITNVTSKWVDRLKNYCTDIETRMDNCLKVIESLSGPILSRSRPIDSVFLSDDEMDKVNSFVNNDYPKMKGIKDCKQVVYVLGPERTAKGVVVNYLLGHYCKRQQRDSSQGQKIRRRSGNRSFSINQPLHLTGQGVDFCDIPRVKDCLDSIVLTGMKVAQMITNGLQGILVVIHYRALVELQGSKFIQFMKDLSLVLQEFDRETINERLAIIFSGQGVTLLTETDVKNAIRSKIDQVEDEKIRSLLEESVKNLLFLKNTHDAQVRELIDKKLSNWKEPLDPQKLRFDKFGSKEKKELTVISEHLKELRLNIMDERKSRRVKVKKTLDIVQSEINALTGVKEELEGRVENPEDRIKAIATNLSCLKESELELKNDLLCCNNDIQRYSFKYEQLIQEEQRLLYSQKANETITAQIVEKIRASLNSDYLV